MWSGEPCDNHKHGNFIRFIGFFDKWGELCQKGYLLYMVFGSNLEAYVALTYEYLSDYIESGRNGYDILKSVNLLYEYRMERFVKVLKKKLKRIEGRLKPQSS